MAESWIKTGLNTSPEVLPIQGGSSNTSFFDNGISDETKKGLDILVYADSNSGKTYFANTAPEPIYYIDTEGRESKTRQFHFPGKKIYITSPLDIREDYKKLNEMENVVDMEKSIDNLVNALIEISNKVKSGEITEGTIVIDSMTDVWSWVQEQMKIKLAKTGGVDIAKERIKNQWDWGPITKKYLSILMSVKSFTDKGINVVLTSREKKSPDYLAQPENVMFEEKIKTQKDTPFHMSTIINIGLRKIKTPTGIKSKRIARIEKLESISCDEIQEIEDITFDKLKKLIDENRTKMIGGK